MAQHHIPFSLLGWNSERIGLFRQSVDLVAEVSLWMAEATAENCHTILVSAEDFSLLSSSDWVRFGESLAAAQTQASVEVSEVTVWATRRETQARAVSEYREALKHGLSAELPQVISALTERFERNHQTFLEIPKALPWRVNLGQIDYSNADFVSQWMNTVLGYEIASALPEGFFHIMENPTVSALTQEDLLRFNRQNTPPSINELRPFISLIELTDETERGWQRLMLFRTLVDQRDASECQSEALRAELESSVATLDKVTQQRDEAVRNLEESRAEFRHVLNSTSWKVTEPLRRIGKRIRRRR
jgi:hypothetical protein